MERSIVRVWIAVKHRPAVVLETDPDLVRVAYGTSETHEWRHEVVHTDTRQGRMFDLKETTYFYGANTSWELPAALQPCGAACSWDLFFAIRRLVEEYDATIEE